MMCYSVMTQAYSEKEIPSSPNRSRTYDLPITSSDGLPLSYRRLVGAEAIKLGSWDKQALTTLSLFLMEFRLPLQQVTFKVQLHFVALLQAHQIL